MKITSVQVGSVTLNVGDTIVYPAQPAGVFNRKGKQGAREKVETPAQPAKAYKIEGFDMATGGVQCRDEHGSALSITAATAVEWKAKE